jgi:hypothetical protein
MANEARAGTLSVLGKKRRERVALTMPAPTQTALEVWLQVRGTEPGPLFLALDPASGSSSGGAHSTTRLTGRSVARIARGWGASDRTDSGTRR